MLDDEHRVLSGSYRNARAGDRGRITNHRPQIDIYSASQSGEEVVLAVTVLTDCKRPELVRVLGDDEADLIRSVQEIHGVVVMAVGRIGARGRGRRAAEI